jgi:hypothetical protein
LAGDERLLYAEKSAMAFWKAMTGRDDDDDEESDEHQPQVDK